MNKRFFPIKNFEARVFVTNPDLFLKKLLTVGGQKIKNSKFTDYIYEPKGKQWDLSKQDFKLRIFTDEKGKEVAEFRYHPSEFKDGIKREILFFDAVIPHKEDAFKMLEDWNFRELFHFDRISEVYEVADQLVTLENIEGLGWMVEVEGDRWDEVEKLMTKLNIFGDRVAKTLPELVQELRNKKK